jgi:hypothetical protein
VANIKLSTFVEQRPFYILLENKCSEVAVAVSLSSVDSMLYIVKAETDSDSIAPIAVLAWFNYPNIFDLFAFPLSLFKFLIDPQKGLVVDV